MTPRSSIDRQDSSVDKSNPVEEEEPASNRPSKKRSLTSKQTLSNSTRGKHQSFVNEEFDEEEELFPADYVENFEKMPMPRIMKIPENQLCMHPAQLIDSVCSAGRAKGYQPAQHGRPVEAHSVP